MSETEKQDLDAIDELIKRIKQMDRQKRRKDKSKTRQNKQPSKLQRFNLPRQNENST